MSRKSGKRQITIMGKRIVRVQLTMEELDRVIYGLDDLATQFRANEHYDVLANKLDVVYQQQLNVDRARKKRKMTDEEGPKATLTPMSRPSARV